MRHIRVQVCVICECVFKSCLLNSISSGLLVIPGVSTLPCVTLDVVSKDYYFEVTSSSACSSSLPGVCTVTIPFISIYSSLILQAHLKNKGHRVSCCVESA